MSATSKRNRALMAGVEPVTDKSIHMGNEPMPEHLAQELAVNMAVIPDDEPTKKVRKKSKKEKDDG